MSVIRQITLLAIRLGVWDTRWQCTRELVFEDRFMWSVAVFSRLVGKDLNQCAR